jgi:hypothetical protein
MKATFETEDPKEIIQLAKASDMACFIWELTHNGWRDFKHTDYDYEKAWDKINELLEEFNINPDELV